MDQPASFELLELSPQTKQRKHNRLLIARGQDITPRQNECASRGGLFIIGSPPCNKWVCLKQEDLEEGK